MVFKVKKRLPHFWLAGLAAAVLGLPLIWPGGLQGQTEAPSPGGLSSATSNGSGAISADSEPIDELILGRVERIRSRIGLTRTDLAAMDMDTAQARATLVQLKTWAETRGAELDQMRAQRRILDDQQTALMRQVNLGTASTDWRRQHEKMQEEAKGLSEREGELYEDAAAAAASSLTSAQTQLREASQYRSHLRGGLRYLELESQTTARNSSLLRRTESTSSISLSDQSPEERLAHRLTAAQQLQLETYQKRISQRWDEVLAAEREVFFGEGGGGSR